MLKVEGLRKSYIATLYTHFGFLCNFIEKILEYSSFATNLISSKQSQYPLRLWDEPDSNMS
jgi:hypothetical protein